MSATSVRKERKTKLIARLNEYLATYNNVLLVGVDNVGSQQMQDVRFSLRGKAAVLLGKNTLMRKVIRDYIAKSGNQKLEALLPYVVGNMGFVFTNTNLNDVRKEILSKKIPAAARVGSIAPNDVVVPAGSTGLDPGQTSFFQVLNIATKIVKGAIEILNPVTLIKTGDKVTASHVSLLDKLNIRPFQYGLSVNTVYEDGNVYDAKVLDMSPEDVLGKFMAGVSKVAAVSLAIGYPTTASLPHIVGNAVQKVLAIALATDYTFELATKLKEMLANPGAFAAAAPAAEAAKPVEAAKEESEESGGDMGFSLFD